MLYPKKVKFRKAHTFREQSANDYLWAVRVGCGGVDTEEKMIHELQQINRTLRQRSY